MSVVRTICVAEIDRLRAVLAETERQWAVDLVRAERAEAALAEAREIMKDAFNWAVACELKDEWVNETLAFLELPLKEPA